MSEVPNSQGILEAFKQLSEMLPYLIINLAAISREYTTKVLCENLKVYDELVYLFELVSGISDMT